MDDRTNSLILDIYDTIVDDTLWHSVLDKVAALVDARGCIMFRIDDQAATTLTATHFSSRYDPDLVKEYNHIHAALELADQRIFAQHSAAGDSVDIISDEVLASGQDELAARENSKAMAAFGIYHRAGALLSKDNPRQNRFSVQFSKRHGPLNEKDRKILNILLPHMSKACELARPVTQLRRVSSNLAAALDKFRIGVCVIRSTREIVAQNLEFERQMSDTGIFYRTASGQIAMQRQENQQWLLHLMSDIGHHGQFGARPRKEAMGAIRKGSGTVLSVELAPLTSADAFGETRLDGFVIYSLDTSKPIDLDIDVVAQTLLLTKSEASLVELLSQGLTNREIAEQRDRSVETVNSQVKSLLVKTGCANRTQIIRRATNIGADFLTDLTHTGDVRT